MTCRKRVHTLKATHPGCAWHQLWIVPLAEAVDIRWPDLHSPAEQKILKRQRMGKKPSLDSWIWTLVFLNDGSWKASLCRTHPCLFSSAAPWLGTKNSLCGSIQNVPGVLCHSPSAYIQWPMNDIHIPTTRTCEPTWRGAISPTPHPSNTQIVTLFENRIFTKLINIVRCQ